MKKLILSMAIVMVSLLCAGSESPAKVPLKEVRSSQLPGYTYVFKGAFNGTFKVRGRRIATDGDFLYVSSTKSLCKYDKRGRLVAKNDRPFDGYPLSANLFGDIDVFDGELFISATDFLNGVSRNVQIVVHDANTLKFKKVFKSNPGLKLAELPSICVDSDKRTLWAYS